MILDFVKENVPLLKQTLLALISEIESPDCPVEEVVLVLDLLLQAVEDVVAYVVSQALLPADYMHWLPVRLLQLLYDPYVVQTFFF